MGRPGGEQHRPSRPNQVWRPGQTRSVEISQQPRKCDMFDLKNHHRDTDTELNHCCRMTASHNVPCLGLAVTCPPRRRRHWPRHGPRRQCAPLPAVPAPDLTASSPPKWSVLAAELGGPRSSIVRRLWTVGATHRPASRGGGCQRAVGHLAPTRSALILAGGSHKSCLPGILSRDDLPFFLHFAGDI